MMADGGAATELASASLAAVLADRGADAALALASSAAVLTDGGAAAALARAFLSPVLAEANPPAFSTSVLSAVVRAFLLDPRHAHDGGASCLSA